MRLTLLIALACIACHRGPKQFHSTGRLVFDARPATEADVYLATEAEVLRSTPVLQQVHDEWGHDVNPEALSVSRHADTMILDVTVADADPSVAADACNHVLRAYVERRREMVVMEIRARQEAIGHQLEATPDNADLERQLQVLDADAQIAKTDVRLLEPCKVPAS